MKKGIGKILVSVGKVTFMNLILFTNSYPYIRGGEQNFLDVEIGYLAHSFDKIFLVPFEKKEKELPGGHLNASVEEGYSILLQSQNTFSLFLRALFSPLLIKGLLEKNFPHFSFHALRKLIAFVGKAELTRRWVEGWLKSTNINEEECVFYTYWFDNAAAGVGLARKKHPGIKLISRAHNYDIYEERYTPPYIPCRHFALSSVDLVLACSSNGAEYLRRKYPEFENRVQTSLLGVEDPGFINQPSNDGVLRIVSCSFLHSKKRVPMLLEAFALAARENPSVNMEWRHIGNGNERDDLQKTADKNLPASAHAFFIDYIDNSTLMKFYQENPVDVFVNVSAIEGIPVSIMEAISCGIPVIATAVGGNVEIVSNQNGILLNADPTLDEIATALLKFIEHPEKIHAKRNGSRMMWSSRYDAHGNFSLFAKLLRDIR